MLLVAPLNAGEGRSTDALERCKILMVDDEPNNLLALEAVLGGLGQDLVRATSGKGALRCLLDDEFAVILMDVQMPEMDGFATAALIRARERTRYTPILFLTAAGKSEAEIFRGYEIGAVDYLLKPFAPEILRQKVRVLIELHQKTAEIKRLNLNLELRVQERTVALEIRSQELLRSNQDLAQFAAVASHDLQEPLRTLSTYLQMFRDDNQGQFNDHDRGLLEVVLSSAHRMRELINDLLAFSQVGQGPRRLEPVDFGALVATTVALFKTRLDERGAKVSVGALPTLEGEPLLLGQVFQNLLGNALKFSESGVPMVDVTAAHLDGRWVFSIKDNGIGIDPLHFDRIFKLFQRLHSRDDYPGNGLGLSICKKVVERHGGTIWLESAPGSGSTFLFSIPDIQRAYTYQNSSKGETPS